MAVVVVSMQVHHHQRQRQVHPIKITTIIRLIQRNHRHHQDNRYHKLLNSLMIVMKIRLNRHRIIVSLIFFPLID